MNAQETRQAIQHLLHVAEDGIVGQKTEDALRLLSSLQDGAQWPPEQPEADQDVHEVKASSFADPGDIAGFRNCKAQGNSDQFCFGKGDNGIGKWGDDCSEGSGPRVALPPEVWAPLGKDARGAKVLVKANGREVVCELRDTMPHLANIRNGAGIDLNPDACAALGLNPPVMAKATWQWA